MITINEMERWDRRNENQKARQNFYAPYFGGNFGKDGSGTGQEFDNWWRKENGREPINRTPRRKK